MALDFQYDELMLEKSTVRNAQAGGVTCGYEFNIRYPSYRGTFLSCIEGFRVMLDGKEIPPGDMRFTLKGKQFLISELHELAHEYWYVLDDATVTVYRDGGLPAGAKELSVELVHRVPYTGYFGEYLTLTSTGTLNIGGAENE